jgi:hypothetical protein
MVCGGMVQQLASQGLIHEYPDIVVGKGRRMFDGLLED